jgi:predicted Zn-dependent peptidase
LPKAFDVLSDILRPSLREDDFDTEKKVIIEEIRMYLDSPMSVAYEAAKAAHFGGHPLGQSILGTVESITDLPVAKMRDYFAHYYSPANIVLAFAGKSDWRRLVDLAEEHCGSWEGSPAGREAIPPRGTGTFRTILRAEDQQQTIIGMADGPSLESDDRYAAQLLATVLGDHTGSRLYWTLVDPGHADGAEVGYQDYNQAGVFFTFLSCEPDEAQANLGRVAEAYRNVMTEGITDEELERAKNKVMARNVLRSERPMGRLTSLGFHWTYRREYLTVESELDAFARVTPADVRRVLDAYPLLPQTIVSVGPTVDLHPAE